MTTKNEQLINELNENQTLQQSETVKAFLNYAEENSAINPELTSAVISQFTTEEFLSYAENVAEHDIAGGYNGYVYYTDTVAFVIENKTLIMQWLKEFAESMSDEGVIAMLQQFQYMKNIEATTDDIAEVLYANDEENDIYNELLNAVAWIVAEYVCHCWTDYLQELTIQQSGTAN